MLFLFMENWSLHVLRGCLAVAFGLMALLWPGLTLGVLIILFGLYALFEGILAVVAAAKHRRRRYWWLLLLEGIAGITAGVATFYRTIFELTLSPKGVGTVPSASVSFCRILPSKR